MSYIKKYKKATNLAYNLVLYVQTLYDVLGQKVASVFLPFDQFFDHSRQGQVSGCKQMAFDQFIFLFLLNSYDCGIKQVWELFQMASNTLKE